VDVVTHQGDPSVPGAAVSDVEFSRTENFSHGQQGCSPSCGTRPMVAAAPALSHESAVRAAAFSADGHRVVTASFEGTVQVWDTLTGPVREPPRDESFESPESASVTADWPPFALILWRGPTTGTQLLGHDHRT